MMKTSKYFKPLMVSAFCLFCLSAGSVAAQTQGQVNGDSSQGVIDNAVAPAAMDAEVYKNLEDAYKTHLKLGRPDFEPSSFASLFYTIWQHNLLQDAKRQFRTRKPGEYEEPVSENPEERERGIRELSVGGILYKTADDWIVWMNGQRVTPEAIPSQVIDIKVNKEYVELKWLDSYNNLIFPIRIRPHQRFNLDTRIFLPGRSAL